MYLKIYFANLINKILQKINITITHADTLLNLRKNNINYYDAKFISIIEQSYGSRTFDCIRGG